MDEVNSNIFKLLSVAIIMVVSIVGLNILIDMNVGILLQMIWMVWIVFMAINVMWVMPYIERITEYRADNHSYTMPKKIRYWVMFFGPFVLLFKKRIKKMRKERHYEFELDRLKKMNRKGQNDKKILTIERQLKLNKIKPKRTLLWHQ